MLIPSIPLNEPERLQDLHNAKLLDTPIHEGFERITRLAKNLFHVPIVAISLVDENRQWFKSIQGLDACETPREVSFCGHAILQEDIFVVQDTHLDPRFSDNPLVINEPYIRFYAGYPIKSERGYKYGTICLIDHVPRNLTNEDLLELQDLAAFVETEIAKQNSCYAHEKLICDLDQAKLASMVDPLTRLWNRSGMRNILNYQMESYSQTGIPFGLAILDIDHFKLINDTYGHNVGDVVLRSLSKYLVRSCRDKDAPSRWGGEEFLLLINEPDKNSVHRIAERIRGSIEQQNIIYGDKNSLKITVTIGVATLSQNTSLSVDDLITQADQALYEGKNTGRNKVIHREN